MCEITAINTGLNPGVDGFFYFATKSPGLEVIFIISQQQPQEF